MFRGWVDALTEAGPAANTPTIAKAIPPAVAAVVVGVVVLAPLRLAPDCLQSQGVRNAELELEFDPLHLVENSMMRNIVPAPRSTADRVRDSMVSMTQMTGFNDDSIGSDRAKEAEAQELEEAGTNVDPIPGLPIQSSVV